MRRVQVIVSTVQCRVQVIVSTVGSFHLTTAEAETSVTQECGSRGSATTPAPPARGTLHSGMSASASSHFYHSLVLQDSLSPVAETGEETTSKYVLCYTTLWGSTH